MNESIKIQYKESFEVSELRKIDPGAADRHKIWAENQPENNLILDTEYLKSLIEKTPEEIHQFLTQAYNAIVEHNKNILSPKEIEKKILDHMLEEAKNEKRT